MRGVSLVPMQVAWKPGYEDGYEASEQYSVHFKQPLSTLHDETPAMHDVSVRALNVKTLENSHIC